MMIDNLRTLEKIKIEVSRLKSIVDAVCGPIEAKSFKEADANAEPSGI